LLQRTFAAVNYEWQFQSVTNVTDQLEEVSDPSAPKIDLSMKFSRFALFQKFYFFVMHYITFEFD